jgi:DNA mismatch repair ATPase MutL
MLNDKDSYQWLHDLLSVRNPGRPCSSAYSQRSRSQSLTPRLGVRPPRCTSLSADKDEDLDRDVACRHDTPVMLPLASLPLNDVSFSATSLATADILGQVDRKYIACVVLFDSKDDRLAQPAFVVIDQHAADERVSLEAILFELCEGFITGDVVTDDLSKTPRNILLSREDHDILKTPGVLEVFRRWGLELELPGTAAEHVQVTVRTVPAVLSSRLRGKETTEITRLVKLYLHVLDQSLGEILALIADIDTTASKRDVDWGIVLRWMPQEMLGLAKSKACRGTFIARAWLILQVRSCSVTNSPTNSASVSSEDSKCADSHLSVPTAGRA